MKVPSCGRHKRTGLAYVTIHGKQVSLGKYGSPESISRFERTIAGYLADISREDAATVVELCALYLDHAEQYCRKDGKITGEVHIIRQAIRKLRRLYG